MTGLVTVSAGASHVGCRRKLNEDAYLVRPEAGMWAVCDGVGGHDAGEVASRSIVTSLAALTPPGTASALLAEVRAAVTRVNSQLRFKAGPDRTIASTTVILLAFGDHFACLWAGDSRIYRLRDGKLTQISRDHSLVQDMVDKGMITPEQAEHHPRGNVVTRAVGAADTIMLDKVNDRIQPGDLFLLCSDGLSKVVAQERIVAALTGHPVDAAVDKLIEAALEAGAPDNVTVVAVSFRDDGAEATIRPMAQPEVQNS